MAAVNRFGLVAGLAVASLAAGCELFGPVTCTTEARPGIVVEVVDSVTDQRVSDATVILVDGGWQEILEAPQGTTAGAYERAGTYRVQAAADGYAPWARYDVRVTGDECHVRTVELTARLQAAP